MKSARHLLQNLLTVIFKNTHIPNKVTLWAEDSVYLAGSASWTFIFLVGLENSSLPER